MKKYSTILKTVSVMVISSFLLLGCSATDSLFGKRDNGSLDYQNTRLLDPLQIPNNKNTQAFVQLYSTMDLGDSPVKIVNDSGKQYQLPAPRRDIN